ncbi:hypothetical protein AVEN_156514-1, partial [Araneus ventricosus]
HWILGYSRFEFFYPRGGRGESLGETTPDALVPCPVVPKHSFGTPKCPVFRNGATHDNNLNKKALKIKNSDGNVE